MDLQDLVGHGDLLSFSSERCDDTNIYNDDLQYEKVTLVLPSGRKIIITSENFKDANIYVEDINKVENRN